MTGKFVAFIAATGLLAAAAIAATMQGAQGRGTALGDNGRAANFQFHVAKVEDQGMVHVGGRFMHGERPSNSRPGFSISTDRIAAVEVSGDHKEVCNFGGPAVLTVHTPNGIKRIPGMLSVRVVDRNRGSNSDLDLYGVSFKDRDGKEIYSFAGGVRQGNIQVFYKES